MAVVEIKGVQYFDVPGVVESMGVKTSTVRAWIRGGKLKAHRVGRKYYIKGGDLQRFIESGPTPAEQRETRTA